jgi:hypothetical protein
MHKMKKNLKSDQFKTRRGMFSFLDNLMDALPHHALSSVHLVPKNASTIQKMSGLYTKNVRLAHKNARLHRQLPVFLPHRQLGTVFANSR